MGGSLSKCRRWSSGVGGCEIPPEPLPECVFSSRAAGTCPWFHLAIPAPARRSCSHCCSAQNKRASPRCRGFQPTTRQQPGLGSVAVGIRERWEAATGGEHTRCDLRSSAPGGRSRDLFLQHRSSDGCLTGEGPRAGPGGVIYGHREGRCGAGGALHLMDVPSCLRL